MQDDWEEKEIDLEDEAPEDVLDRLASEPRRLPWMFWGLAVTGIAAALVWYFTHRLRPPEHLPAKPPAAAETPAAVEPGEPAADVPAIQLPALSASDELFRKMVSGLSSHFLLESLLGADDLIRKLVVIVANLSNGESPASQLSYLRPEERFSVRSTAGGIAIDPESYRRYDAFADFFVSLDDRGVANLYRLFRPLLEEAHAELGLAERRDFEDTLARAVGVLMATPVVQGRIPLRAVSVNYAFEDSALERLTPAQKQLLRMGPDNTRRIQQKLTELAAALGLDSGRER